MRGGLTIVETSIGIRKLRFANDAVHVEGVWELARNALHFGATDVRQQRRGVNVYVSLVLTSAQVYSATIAKMASRTIRNDTGVLSARLCFICVLPVCRWGAVGRV